MASKAAQSGKNGSKNSKDLHNNDAVNKKHNNKKPNASLTQKGDSSAKLSKRKRDLERRLRKKDLPATVRQETEKSLQAVELQLENAQRKVRARNYAKKYHMVKFFEKKKALRKYNSAKKELETLIEKESAIDRETNKEQATSLKKEIKKAKKKLHHCEVDVLYVVNFPKDQKYIALYPKEDAAGGKLSELPEIIKRGKVKTELERLAMKKRISLMIHDKTIPVTIEEVLSGHIDHEKLIEQQQFAKLAEPDKIPQKQVKGKKAETGNDAKTNEDEFFE